MEKTPPVTAELFVNVQLLNVTVEDVVACSTPPQLLPVLLEKSQLFKVSAELAPTTEKTPPDLPLAVVLFPLKAQFSKRTLKTRVPLPIRIAPPSLPVLVKF